jgi:hypothetical protein
MATNKFFDDGIINFANLAREISQKLLPAQACQNHQEHGHLAANHTRDIFNSLKRGLALLLCV